MGKMIETKIFKQEYKNRESIFTFSYTRVYNDSKITYHIKFAINNHKI